MKPPSLEQQISKAQEIVKKRHPDIPLVVLPEQPILFLDGWRVPYSLSYETSRGIFRLRGSMLILFFTPKETPQTVRIFASKFWSFIVSKGIRLLAWVRKNANRLNNSPNSQKSTTFQEWDVHVEQDELATSDTRTAGLKKMRPSQLKFPSLTEVYKEVLNSDVQRIEKVELALSDYVGDWRAEVVIGLTHINGAYHLYSYDYKGMGYCKIPQGASSGIGWVLPGIQYHSDNSLTIAPPVGSPAYVNQEKVELTAWACRRAIKDFFYNLGHADPHLRNIITCYNPKSKCETRYVDQLAVITLNQTNGSDPSVVLHEFAHALWYVFYVVTPENLKCPSESEGPLSNGWYRGIEEGFADYFAGRLLTDKDPKSFQIGAYSVQKQALEITNNHQAPTQREIAKRKSGWLGTNLFQTLSQQLRPKPKPSSIQSYIRPITGNYECPDAQANAHVVGQQWANLLWNLQEHLRVKGTSQRDIDQLILYAHFKPRFKDETIFNNPFECYYASLLETARVMNIDSSGWNITCAQLAPVQSNAIEEVTQY